MGFEFGNGIASPGGTRQAEDFKAIVDMCLCDCFVAAAVGERFSGA